MHHYITAPATFMHKEPKLKAEVVSQALFSEQVSVLEEESGWKKIETMSDRYQGWVASPTVCSIKNPFPALGSGSRVMINRPAAHLYDQEEIIYGPSLTLPYESMLELVEFVGGPSGRWTKVRLPGGECKFVQRGDLLVNPIPLSIDDACSLSLRFLGVTYTWGGRSSFGYDCSGFVQMLYRRMGLLLPRDSKDQYLFEKFRPVEQHQLNPGDLIFFGHHKDKICHVGFCLGKGQFIHTSTVYAEAPYLRINHLSEETWNGRGYFPYLSARTTR